MTLFIIGFGLGLISYYSALISVGHAIHKSKSFKDFINLLLYKVYAVISVVIFFWLIGSNITLLIAAGTTYLITLSFIDYEQSYENVLKE